jgi:hypothetical protein
MISGAIEAMTKRSEELKTTVEDLKGRWKDFVDNALSLAIRPVSFVAEGFGIIADNMDRILGIAKKREFVDAVSGAARQSPQKARTLKELFAEEAQAREDAMIGGRTRRGIMGTARPGGFRSMKARTPAKSLSDLELINSGYTERPLI